MKSPVISEVVAGRGESRKLDAYIADAPEFAQPILTHLRGLVHRASPEIEEAIKWRQPFFLHRGSLLCFMAAFKQHCSFGFWGAEMSAVMKQDGREGEDGAKGSRGAFGRITSVADLPSNKEMLGYIKQAIAFTETATDAPKPARTRKPKPEVEPPAEFALAIKQSDGATKAFAALSPSCRREYINWILEAKRAETKERRIQTAVQWITEGKSLNWKYENC
ncbi:uncharacterized protein YdeI (YjbR/CyaY-like superfamily) [Granulicella aggregans]|uniref:Uncharacterized protein YdeI (YjbR/CyaY-like superfamily) n=1 Tax=Granulicella aggregans TaxID=474949 RepID=A0A7W7ZEX0_9BACT|nr:YdeI/OmpD-associated family protein [Granulicella aggregans]MBB5058581.1 uncharacterized protein YdeI (YjbR/CyaY-like superfamily) [Granulicella aggregans]